MFQELPSAKSFNLLAVYPNHGEFGLKRQGKTLNPEGRNAFSWVRFEFRYKERMPDIFSEKGLLYQVEEESTESFLYYSRSKRESDSKDMQQTKYSG